MCELYLGEGNPRRDIDNDEALRTWATTRDGLLNYVNHCEADTYFVAALAMKIQMLPLTKVLTNLAGNSWQERSVVLEPSVMSTFCFTNFTKISTSVQINLTARQNLRLMMMLREKRASTSRRKTSSREVSFSSPRRVCTINLFWSWILTACIRVLYRSTTFVSLQ